MTAQLANVIDRLVSILTAPLAAAGVTIIDGDPVSTPTGTLDYVIVAGTEDPVNDLEDRASAEISWAGLGAKRRDENGDIRCVVGSQSGNNDVPVRRRRVMELLAVAETAILADLSLAGAVQFQTAVNVVGMKSGQNNAGCYALVRFTVHYETRI